MASGCARHLGLPAVALLTGLCVSAAAPETCANNECQKVEAPVLLQQSSSMTRGSCAPLPYNAPEGTNCPRTPWIDEMVEADHSPGKIVMDVGCNKGDDAVEWLERWDQSGTFWSKKAWVDLYTEKFGMGDAYACGRPDVQGFKRAASLSGGNAFGGSSVVCVEPMHENVNLLEKAAKELGYDRPGRHGSFTVVQAALADKAGKNETVEFPDGKPGQEDLGLTLVERQHVKLSTVDLLAADLKLPRIDILTIDTEGADPSVLAGASAMLASVRYLEFEVHRDLKETAWGRTSLHSVVTSLDKLGFECYWAGNSGVLISMNRCWTTGFEQGAWANAACVKRTDMWAPILEKHTQAS
eukprot:CAMPEP_0197936144 /NCGR_PEP_ID=MMETSP1439-20131203/114445_1 /TAXON_ID=66791 /ORGANISM="Gonyaulax spinifera, Strain CCMP409" /LENGTH=354 /DNA_ID=CAMNT_0043559105 /DNA_START=53 /DNA_END=1117 /DNA_ORIENTATION=-